MAMRIWRSKTRIQLVFDVAAWGCAGLLAAAVMGNGAVSVVELASAATTAVVLQLLLGLLIGLYRSRYHYGSFAEYGSIAIIALIIACGLMAVTLGDSPFVLLTVFSAFIFMTGSRYLVRWSHQIATRPLQGERVLVVGAGNAAESLIRQMLSDPDGAYLPVGLIDDDPHKRQLSIHGVRVRGTSEDIAEVAGWLNVSGVIVAIADSDADFLQTCRDRLQPTGKWLRTIPPLAEMVNRKVEIGDIRDIKVEDLIGRAPVHTDLAEIAKKVAGKRVLVTGAGGSIGSELCRQLFALHPESLVMLDRDETALHGVELTLYGSALLMSPNTVLADIRDRSALDHIFAEAKPQIVFHAAALKHLPMLQRFPEEAWKTNVHGTLNVLEAAHAVGVETFVNISTDKAAAPTSELGRSKRIAERLVSGFAAKSPGTYLSVRFGNVLGSRGSVLLSFQEQIRQGGPITVTDPEVRRFFMTIPEACQLVLQAATIGEDGYVMVLDMGEPVRIVDIARSLVAMSNQTTEIVYTGLREGEKLDEELFGDYEGTVIRIHDKISRVEAPSLDAGAMPLDSADRAAIDLFCSRACTNVDEADVRRTESRTHAV
ncbi:NDP-sugar epimerase, includes UDP-GlcNAc-inverting 4,6-dehydratase FlaA1 and capsular polysaccharide biosynthesis protein EpsC [Brevibacterium linens ATCC 9172]|uniref:NDP-sugar epimerase, includes UDP-GlcNAc-inverting 4,6-dehydratase FlaA1 and capsular polysaccharide biosynthesis protein EpsC n=2 Tax=Brevibacterium linens TaxID=1703 RepID=A0A2H1JV15_BRELN|nr:NDP-sugar epimerase, includes UDP-GlcNAc-inverting 4,6-dehydratase FlaA1 and capsular polysaccharide biosynthesis protein EpsC [Brevibacterium linens ATCC 9172]